MFLFFMPETAAGCFMKEEMGVYLNVFSFF